MNSNYRRWMLSFITFFCLLCMASDAVAGKPSKPPRPSDDPCASLTTFTPEFVFWRDTSSRKKPQVTIFLAESAQGCEKKLVDFSLKDFDRIRNLKFSSVEDEAGFFGRVVWTSEATATYTLASFVWKLDFRINGMVVDVLEGDPVQILRNGSLDDPAVDEDIFSLDLSPDTSSLVYTHFFKTQPDYYIQELRTLEISSCLNDGPCSFDAGSFLDAIEGDPSDINGDFFHPSWDPDADGIYVMRIFPNPESPTQHIRTIQYYDLASQNTDEFTLLSDTPFIGRPVSGMVEGREFLAVEKEFSVKTGGCEGIFITDVEECLAADDDCFVTPVFAGKYPSWTKDGKLIHAYDGWTPHGGCGLSAVGVYNPIDGSLTRLLDGLEPDAAGGIVE